MDKRIGAQFYTVREYTQTIEDFEETCAKVSKIGYQTVQISATPLGAREMREVLDRYGLEAVTTHRSFDDFQKNLEEIMDYNRTLGCKLCGVGMMPGWARESGEGLSRFIVDTYWLQVGGMEPVSFIRNLGERAMAVHFKDVRVNPDNSTEMAEVGEGNLDWDGIIRSCEGAGVKWALVEQDVCRRNPFESLKLSYDYLRGRGFC